MEQCRRSCEHIFWTCKIECKSELFQVHCCFHGCCAILSGRWCAISLIKEGNRLRMKEQEVVGTNQRWYHLERWSWRRLQMLTKMREGKLDSAWVKAVWVGRVDRSNEHLLLTTKGCVRSRVVRRIPDGNQASYHAEVQGLPWDTLKGSAEMLRNALVRPGEPPRPSRGRPRKDGSPAQARTATTSGHEETRDDPMPGSSDDHLRQPATETDVIEQNIVMDSGTVRTSKNIVMDSGTARTSKNIVMDSGTARTSENIVMDSGNARESDSIVMGSENARASDGSRDQGVLRMDREEGISAEEQARRRLRSKQPDRRSDDETVLKRM